MSNELQTRKFPARLAMILGTVAILLSIPAIAKLFSNEVHWTLIDFVAAGILLTGTGLMIELILRLVKKRTQRLLLIGGCMLALALVWAEMAVGIFGSPIAGS